MARLKTQGKVIIGAGIVLFGMTIAYFTGLLEPKNGTANNESVVVSSEASIEQPVGTNENPLKVSIVSFHGYAPALVANGNSLTTTSQSIFGRLGVNVEFVIQDDIPTLSTIFEANTAHCAWRTSDFWAQEQPNLRNSGHDGRAIMVVDNTQGADAVIARDPSIRRIEDLVGKRVALLQYTPSHGMLLDAIDNSSLSARAKAQIQMVFINVDEGTAGVRAAFESGQVDAAVLWDPDLALALRTSGSHVVYSTQVATNLIYDIIVCDSRVLNNQANHAAIQSFVSGWFAGVAQAESNKETAVSALVQTEEFFQLLSRERGNAFITSLFDNLVWTGLDDNLRILGLVGGTNYYESVYRRFDRIYRAAGTLANPNSPVIPPAESFDYRFVTALSAEHPEARTSAQAPQFTFSAEAAAQAETQTPVLTRPVMIPFESGMSDITREARDVIDTELAPLLDTLGSAYFEVSGNTDSTGTAAINNALSLQRANSVVSYLVSQWNFPRERFVIKGNGSRLPLCNEASPETTLAECRARNRATRIAVLRR